MKYISFLLIFTVNISFAWQSYSPKTLECQSASLWPKIENHCIELSKKCKHLTSEKILECELSSMMLHTYKKCLEFACNETLTVNEIKGCGLNPIPTLYLQCLEINVQE